MDTRPPDRHGPGGPWRGAEFEGQIREALRMSVHEYCSMAKAEPGLDAWSTRITVTVATDAPLPLLHEVLRADAQSILDRELPGARVVNVRCPVERRLPAPGYRIVIDPPLRSRGRLSRTTVTNSFGIAPAEPVWLTLSYGAVEYRFELFAEPDWHAVGRGDVGDRALRLPDAMVAVPRGELLRIRYWEDHVHIQRSDTRPEYSVVLDGVVLIADQPVGMKRSGDIQYVLSTGPGSLFGYSLGRGTAQ